MNPSYRIGWIFFRSLYRFYFRWRICNPERVPASGPVILASNHASFLDPPLIGAALKRDIHYLARETLFNFPLFGAVLRSWNTVPVDRDGGTSKGLKTIIGRLKSGAGIILFPEGTRSRDGRLQPGRAGVGMIILKSSVPVVPVRVFGTFDAFGRDMKFPRPRRVGVKFGHPLLFEKERTEVRTASRERSKQLYSQVSEEVMRRIRELEWVHDKSTFP